MQFTRLITGRTCSTIVAAAIILVLWLAPSSVEAGQVGSASVFPVVLAKNWLIGYALVFLCILLGLLAVLIPSMRKALRKKEF